MIPKIKQLYALAAAFCVLFNVNAAEPSGYYTSCENKCGDTLLKALSNTVSQHTVVSYDGLWDLYKTSDVRDNGKVWDMYSTKEWTPGQNKCGNYKNVGDCYNREHSFPKSWFNDARPMYSDAFHLYPTDGKVNGQRSNFPYGECANGTTLPSNGNVHALGRLGTSTFPGYSGRVFEPVDEYKGDFARSYFYMATAYNSRIAGWSSDMLARNSYPCFSGWALELLLKWHRQDPVSPKETKRQEAVYARQKNRNPYIDHPELVEHIWGDKKNVNWSLAASNEPVLLLPVNGSTIDLGVASTGTPRTAKAVVKGVNLTENVSLSVSGAAFSVSPATVSAAAANAENGATVTITYSAPAAGNASGSLRITSGKLTSTVSLTARAYDGLPATAATNITDASFVAHWTYCGDADSHGCYTLYVFDADGNNVDTYPRAVTAAAEQYLVDELEPSTSYTYRIESASGIRSNTMSVTTGEPIPLIQLLYDGDLYFSTAPGEPSEVAEIMLDIDNIDSDITISVSAPFELSTDRSDWTQTITVSAIEDRFYMRLYGDNEGSYTTVIKAIAGDYVNDDTEVSGIIKSSPDFFEDFEHEAPGGYNNTSVQGTACRWAMSNAGVYSSKSEAKDGSNYMRLGKNSNSWIAMDEDKAFGIGVLSLDARGFGSDGAFDIDIEVSEDQGANWQKVATLSADATRAASYNSYTFTVNRSGNARIRFSQTSGKRVNIDNIAISNYTAGSIDGVTSDYHSWDAYCRDGQLTVELAETSDVMICGMDGVVIYRGRMSAGKTVLDAVPGLYIVNVADFSRRVLVK